MRERIIFFKLDITDLSFFVDVYPRHLDAAKEELCRSTHEIIMSTPKPAQKMVNFNLLKVFPTSN